MGSVQDFGAYARERMFDAGTHRVELRADGFETATVDVRVAPNETVTLRRDLRRTEAPAPVVRAQPKTFYVIPRCYAGTSRPQANQLPKGCQIANLRVIPPEVSSVTSAR